MKAVVINQYGTTGELLVQEMPKPQPESHEVLIRAYATGINPMDYKIREGAMKMMVHKAFPLVLGAECAGTVEAVGEMVTALKAGDRVVASLGSTGGGYAEYAMTEEKNIVKLPDNVDFDQAAAMVVGGLTALQALRDHGHLRPGDHVLINGASGGVGTFAVQVAKLLDGHVTAVCSTENASLVRELGADHVIDYKTADFTKVPGQYNMVFDAVGKSSLDECRNILTENGIYVSTLPSAKRLLEGVISTFTAQKSESMVMKFSQEDMNWLLKRAADGRLRSVIDRTYPLEAVAQAHDYSESGRVKGKLVLAIAKETKEDKKV